MIVNGQSLYNARPIKRMEVTKLVNKGYTYGLGEAGYDIRLAQDIMFSWDFFQRRCVERVDYCQDGIEPISVKRDRGRFMIASSLEEFEMPSNLVGIVHDKSSWARKGLSVFNTVIEPGWRGFLTLELVYHGRQELLLPYGTPIAQVVFHSTTNEAIYTGRYQDQAPEPVEAITIQKNLKLEGADWGHRHG